MQLRVAAAPCPGRFGKAAARSLGWWDILTFGQNSPASVLAAVAAAVGVWHGPGSDTESSEQRGLWMEWCESLNSF